MQPTGRPNPTVGSGRSRSKSPDNQRGAISGGRASTSKTGGGATGGWPPEGKHIDSAAMGSSQTRLGSSPPRGSLQEQYDLYSARMLPPHVPVPRESQETQAPASPYNQSSSKIELGSLLPASHRGSTAEVHGVFFQNEGMALDARNSFEDAISRGRLLETNDIFLDPQLGHISSECKQHYTPVFIRTVQGLLIGVKTSRGWVVIDQAR